MINPNVTQRSQRQQLFQYLGFILFLLLLFVDDAFRAVRTPSSIKSTSDNVQTDAKSAEMVMTSDLNRMLARKRSLSNTFYPRNVSGM